VVLLLVAGFWLVGDHRAGTRDPLAAETIVGPPVACRVMTAPILEGAEPYSAAGDARGALILHGFTGNPQSMRGLALAFADAGFTVEMPLLPGHGTDVADMAPTRWPDWSGAAEQAYLDLAARCDAVVAVGLSMGGSLSVWLAEHHPELAAIVLVNPLVSAPTDLVPLVDEMVEGGMEMMPGVGSDIALEGSVELAYPEVPLRAAQSLFAAAAEIGDGLESVTCPVLLFSSPQDHVVPPDNGDLLAARVKGPLTRVTLERSFHVATLDYDKDEIERGAVEFAAGLLPSPSS
jgi:carboxylesterase